MKKVFLDELPRNFRGILWNECVGIEVNFIYDDINGVVKIISYSKENRRLGILYNGELFDIGTSCFNECKIGRILKRKTSEFLYELGSFKSSTMDIIITDREYRKGLAGRNPKYYKFTCNKCGWTEGWIVEPDLKKKVNCGCCSGRKAVLGINTIWDTNRWMCDLGLSEEDAKKYRPNSGVSVQVKCPTCNKTKFIAISTLKRTESIGCICGDGFSYPEKFVASVLKQSEIEFITQLTRNTLSWCNKYRYDFYIPSLNAIIETHGIQHYDERSGKSRFEMSFIEQRENDLAKEELAKSNNISNYVVIDCRYSNIEHIKENLFKSELSKLLDLSKIDWLKCEEFALSNLVKEVCDYWDSKQEHETTVSIASVFNISHSTIREYLIKGTSLNWCCYNGNDEVKLVGSKNGANNGKVNSKKVEVRDLKGNIVGVFDSANELCRKSESVFGINFSLSSISAICNGRLKTYKNHTMKHV